MSNNVQCPSCGERFITKRPRKWLRRVGMVVLVVVVNVTSAVAGGVATLMILDVLGAPDPQSVAVEVVLKHPESVAPPAAAPPPNKQVKADTNKIDLDIDASEVGWTEETEGYVLREKYYIRKFRVNVRNNGPAARATMQLKSGAGTIRWVWAPPIAKARVVGGVEFAEWSRKLSGRRAALDFDLAPSSSEASNSTTSFEVWVASTSDYVNVNDLTVQVRIENSLFEARSQRSNE